MHNELLTMAVSKKSFAHKLKTAFIHWFAPQRSNNHRPKILHPDSLFTLAFVAVGMFALVQTVTFFPSLHNSILGFTSDITIDKVVAETNQQRQKAGLEPVNLNQQLSAAALAKAQDMFDHQYWSHISPQGKEPWDFINQSGYNYKVAGENLARDFHHSTDMMSAWMKSPTHKANILNGRYDEIGVAVVEGKLEGFETVLVVQMFGAPQVAQATVGDEASQSEKIAVDSSQPEPAVEADQQAEYKSVSADEPSAEKISSEEVQGTEPNIQEGMPDQSIVQDQSQNKEGELVLSQALVPEGGLYHEAVFNPLQLTKIFFLGLILIIVLTLVYDSFVIENRKTMRVVGNNLAHIILFTGIAFLMILFKGGMIK